MSYELPEGRLNPPDEPRMERCMDCDGRKIKCVNAAGETFLLAACRYFDSGDCPESCYLEQRLCKTCDGEGVVPEVKP